MTRDEVKTLLVIVSNTFQAFKADDKTAMIDTWYYYLKDYNASDIEMALKIYVSTSGSGYAPSVPQLIALTHRPAELSQMNDSTAWSKVCKAVRNGLYGSNEEFLKLPEQVQRAVGSPEQLKAWAMLPEDEFNSVIASNFRRTYNAVIKRDEEINRLPLEARSLLGMGNTNLIGENNE